jgi:short-subunit dehydrogenase
MPDLASRLSLQGKRALVTGASRGIGAEIATVFADTGADVAIVGRDAKGLDATRHAIAGKGRRCVAIQADLLEAYDIDLAELGDATIKQLFGALGQLLTLLLRPISPGQELEAIVA